MKNMKEMFQEKLDEAVKQFNEVDSKLKQLEEQVGQLTNAREQIRGRVITLQEFLEDEPTANGPVAATPVEIEGAAIVADESEDK